MSLLRTPVTVLTGFLGSGKTTVLNRVLRAPDCPRIAIVVNEFGSIPIDHDLIESSDEDIVMLAGGCACCSVRADIGHALMRLVRAVADGRLPAFEHIVLETSGIADPGPIEQLFMGGLGLDRRFAFKGVVTCVDAQLAVPTADAEPVWVRQVALADRVLLTKTDLADERAARAALDRVRMLNAIVPCIDVQDCASAVSMLFGDLGYEARGSGTALEPVHDDDLRAYCARFDADLESDDLATWLDTLVVHYASRLLRVKGLVRIAGEARPLVVHAAQHFSAPPVFLDEWPGTDQGTRIAFIVRGLAPVDLESGLPPGSPRPRWGRVARAGEGGMNHAKITGFASQA